VSIKSLHKVSNLNIPVDGGKYQAKVGLYLPLTSAIASAILFEITNLINRVKMHQNYYPDLVQVK
jgi:hypothetical protein